MTENMKTVCVGRFLVDVPAEAAVSLSHEMIGGFDLASSEESETAFRDRIGSREAAIVARGAAHKDDGEGGMMETRELRIPGMIGRVFVYGHSRGYYFDMDRRIDMESASVEAHAHMAGLSFTLSARSTDKSLASRAEALLARLQVRAEDEIPSVPGFCASRAVFAEPLPANTSEHIAMFVSVPRHPELALVLNSMPGGPRDEGLLARAVRTDADAGPDEMLRVTALRVGPRNINGIAGEEALERVHELNFATTYGFLWEAAGIDGDVNQPFLTFELQSGKNPVPGGKPLDASLHGDAMLALWDGVSSTIRLRKSAPPPSAPAQAPEGPKLGATACAGEACPQSGWWECAAGADGMRVHGGQVQFMRRGERMPQALLLPRQTVWQKMRNIQPSIEPDRLTVWQLVDKRTRPRVLAVVSLAPAGVMAPDQSPMAGRGAVIGSYVRTGDPCPASGWWRCEEAHALDGTRWFAAGSLLPAATFSVPAGVFGRASGPEAIQRRSTWQLVRPTDAPPAPDASPTMA
jgi:hypothetical protein